MHTVLLLYETYRSFILTGSNNYQWHEAGNRWVHDIRNTKLMYETFH